MTSQNPLPRSTPESQGISSSAILDFANAVDNTISELHSFMLLRHGNVIAEGWWEPYAPRHNHILFSLTKSFTSTAVGMAVAEGRLSIDDSVLGFFPEDAPKRPSKNLQAMRVRHLLSMSTGHLTDSTEKAVTNPQGNWVKGFFSMPVKHAPGAPFVYNSGASHVLSAIVQKVTGMPISEYLKPRLFDPLGIDGYAWETDPRGINTGGWGLSVKTEDIARFGQLYLQKGLWEGQRLLPEAWVAMATAKQVDNDIDPKGPLDWRQGYGFQFWRCQHNAYRGDGAFGQYCIVMPEQDAVLAITSGVSDMQSVLNLVWEHLLPNMGEVSLPADEAANRKLTTRLVDLCLDPPQGSGNSKLVDSISGRPYTIAENPLGIKSMTWTFSSGRCLLTIEDSTSQHTIECGASHWVMGETSFLPDRTRQRAVTTPESLGIASAYAWAAEDRLEILERFYLAPFYYTITSQFEGDQVTVQAKVNVSFGPTELPDLVGKKSG